ncbi:MAG: DUF3352 domain-containing protein [Solirubrobacteraceae bacterium]
MSALTPPRSTPTVRGNRRWVERASPPSPPVARRRRLLALAVLGVVLALASAGWFVLRGSGTPPPATGAARVVPADVLAYVHLSTDPSRPAVQAARRLADRFPGYPLLYAAVVSRLDGVLGGGANVDFDSQVGPWLGKEAALAVLPSTGASAPTLLVLDVSDRARAQAFLSSVGAASAGNYDGVRLLAYPSGSEVALVGHYLVAGPSAGVRAAIDAARGRVPSLAGDDAYAHATASEPAGRVLDAYLPAAGVTRLLSARGGVAGAIGLLLDRPGVVGSAISVSATSGSPPSLAQVLVHSVMSARTKPGGSTFTPTLQTVLPTGSTLMLDVRDLRRVAPELLNAGALAGIGANVGPLLDRLGAALTAQGVNVRSVLSVFDGETAVALSPGPSPALLIVARVRNQAAAQGELASLEGPLTTLFAPSSGAAAGQVPELADTQVGGTTVHEVQLGPGLQVDYGVFDGLAVVSTSLQAIDGVAQRSHALSDEAAYHAVVPAGSGQVSSLLFGDFTNLLSLGAQTGLTSGTRTRELLPDLSKVRAIGLSSASGENDTTTEMTFEIR